MGDVIKQRLRRYNGTDYDTVHLETDGSVVEVEAPGKVSILNTDSPTLGETVYFRDYPDITWQVQHLDGDYAYLASYPIIGTTQFDPNNSTSYSGSTIASKCTIFLNDTIPNVADCLEEVTVNGVTAKVFIPSLNQLNSEWDWPKAGASNRSCQRSRYWTSTAASTSYVSYVDTYGDFTSNYSSITMGFRPAVKVNYKQTVPGTTTKDLDTALNDVNTTLDDKQDKLTFDATPTASSTNPVTSDGVYTALQSAVSSKESTSNKVTTLSASSTNTEYPSAKAVYDSLQDIDGANVTVTLQEEFTNPLNTDQLTLGQHDVYFTAYPDIKWHVDHIDGDYAYLGLYNVTETTVFGSKGTSYSGSTIASKCTTYLNNTIPNVAQYLEDVTVEGVTAKVFIPTKYQMSGQTGSGDTTGPVFTYLSGSSANQTNMINIDNWSSIGYDVWLSTVFDSDTVWAVNFGGGFSNYYPSNTYGFRPEVKVRFKVPTTDLNTAINDINSRITSGTAELTPGTSALTTGTVYFQYE